MSCLSRREFLQMLAAATAAGMGVGCSKGASAGRSNAPGNLYEVAPFGNVSLLHFTDCHAQLKPMYFREPSINIGVGNFSGKPPHLVGEALLKEFKVAPSSIEAHAFTYLNFEEAARQYGKVGGFAHLATLVKSLRDQRKGRTLLLDGGDTWQGSATALWTKGQDMVDAQNVSDATWGEAVFKPYVIRELNGVRVAIIGQAFPYTPIANPRWMIPDWSFGINDDNMQKMVDKARAEGAKIVVLLSHNGMDVDLKMASRVTGIDAILGGHTHDAVPAPTVVANKSGKTLVINSGSNGKFLSVLDLEFKGGKVTDYRYKLLPVFSNLIAPDAKMTAHIEKVRAPFKAKLEEKLAVTEGTLYRRGNFNGTFDQLIVDAMLEVQGAEIALSPGFRWGTSLLPGDTITLEHLMDQTAITYATATLNERSGEQIKIILEDIADNLFHEDPYYQQGGDMVRVGGLQYTIDPTQKIGKRITDIEVKGKPLDAKKNYKVAGWASIDPNPVGDKQIWDVVGEYLRHKKIIKATAPNTPKLKGVAGNPGIG